MTTMRPLNRRLETMSVCCPRRQDGPVGRPSPSSSTDADGTLTCRPPLALPIDDCLPAIADAIAARGAAVVEAPPGAGKTTRVPRALLDARARDGEIWVLEPRRLPARLAATRVAQRAGRARRRDGRLFGPLRRGGRAANAPPVHDRRAVHRGACSAAPRLPGVGAVVLDELHERHVATDLALAWLRRLRETDRPDLAVVAMSATFDAEPGRRFPRGRRRPQRGPDVRRRDRAPAHARRSAAGGAGRGRGPPIARATSKDGDLLVFLPGAGEIRRAQRRWPSCRACGLRGAAAARRDAARGAGARRAPGRAAQDHPVHQRRRVVGDDRRRHRRDRLRSGADRRRTRPGPACRRWRSPGSARPRRPSGPAAPGGRAPGRALRLYTRHDFEQRPRETEPEIARADLTEVALTLAALGVSDPDSLAWLDPAARRGVGRGARAARAAGRGRAGRAADRRRAGACRASRFTRGWRAWSWRAKRAAWRAAAGLAAALIAERDIRLGARASFGGGPAARHPTAAPTCSTSSICSSRPPRPASARTCCAGWSWIAARIEEVDRARRQLATGGDRAAAAIRRTTQALRHGDPGGVSRSRRTPARAARADRRVRRGRLRRARLRSRRASGWSPSTRRSEAPRAAASSSARTGIVEVRLGSIDRARVAARPLPRSHRRSRSPRLRYPTPNASNARPACATAR